jgi:hypothetical protein
MNYARSVLRIALGFLALAVVVPVSMLANEGKGHSKSALEQYDRDKDGKLSPEEEAARRADIAAKSKATKESNISKYDKDGDGKLNDEEKAAKKAAEDAEKAAQKAERDAKKKSK